VKGIIFNLLEEVISAEHGPEAWDDLLDAAGSDGVYTALGNYRDAEFVALLAQLPAAFGGGDVDEHLRWFGRSSMPLLAERYRPFFERPDSTASFLRSINDVIHTEVRKLYPDADVPTFDFDPVPDLVAPDDAVVMGYSSRRRLCALAEGFIEGAARQYGERAVVKQPRCMHRGHEKCVLVCTFAPAA
jgi:predicted hydrocarbon binding protein